MTVSIGDLPQWQSAYSRIYDLVHRDIVAGNSSIRLYNSPSLLGRGIWSTAPYLTDGGVPDDAGLDWKSLNDSLADSMTSEPFKYVLLKSRRKISGDLPECIFEQTIYRTYLLNLKPTPGELFKKFKGSRRTEIRKAESFAPTVDFGHIELLEDFYEVVSMRWKELGTPIHSKAFYSEILQAFGSEAKIVVLRINGVALSTAMLIYGDRTLFHPFAATDRRANRFALNSLLYWEIIKYGYSLGAESFDLGRSRQGQGTVPFKLSWNSQEVALHYYFFAKSAAAIPNYDSTVSKILNTGWSYLPVSFTKVLGPTLIKGVL